MSLADLMRKGSLRALATTAFATATPATVATHEEGCAATVAEVATVAVAKSPNSKAANDPALDPDRWCWPHSAAMTGAEIDCMVSRVERFVARGVDLIEATALADKLVLRDRDGDDRRLCLECDHLRPGERCGVRTVADVSGGRLIDALPNLQRCNQFKKTTP